MTKEGTMMRLVGWRRSLAWSLSAVLVLATVVFAGSLAIPGLQGNGSGSAFAAAACAQTYTVQSGDTLADIAYRYGLSVGQLASLNSLPNYDVIYIGQTLCLPAASATAASANEAATASSADAASVPGSGGIAVSQTPGGICVLGRKINDLHQGLEGFVISAQMAGSPDSLHTVSDEHGYFGFEDLQPGLWTFSEVVPRGWEPVTASEFDIELEYGHQGCYEIRFKNREVPIPACLVVSKSDYSDASPLGDWEIQIKPANGGTWQSGVTDVSGQVRFNDLEPGNWLVREVAQYPWFAVQPSTGQAEVLLTAMEDEDDCYKLAFANSREATGCVEGYKVDDNHRGLPGWEVCAESPDLADPIFCTTTIEGGYFRFDNLTMGEWDIWEDPAPGWTAVTAERFTVIVDDTEECVRVRFKNRAPDLCAQGYKLDDQGFGLSGWTVKAWPKDDPDSILQTTTDSDGRYRICGVTLGTWVFAEERQLGWTALAAEEQQIDIQFPGAGKDVQAPIFRNAPPRGCIEGWKVDELEVGLPMWNITVQNVATSQTWHRWTDGTGYFQVCGLPMGDYLVWEEMQTGWKPVTAPEVEVTLEASEEDVIAMVVFVNAQVPRDICIDGYKRDGFDGAGLPNWQVRLLDTAGNQVAVTNTDGTGYYRFGALEAGTYVVEESAEEGWRSTSGTSRTVTVSFPPRHECTSVDFTNVQTTAAPLPCIAVHYVAYGQTLSIISQLYAVPASAIMRANGISDGDFIWVGQELCIPDP